MAKSKKSLSEAVSSEIKSKFDLGKFIKGVKAVNNNVPIFKISCNDNLNENSEEYNWEELTDWIKEYLNTNKVL